MNILMGILYFFPSLFLFKFASSIGRLLDGGGATEMEEALSNQKSFWKFVGILVIIAIILGVLGVVAAIIISIFARFIG
jgi:ABC-type sugar transport system permease subunit